MKATAAIVRDDITWQLSIRLPPMRHEKSLVKPTFNLAFLTPRNVVWSKGSCLLSWRKTDRGVLSTVYIWDPAPAEILNPVSCRYTKECRGECSYREGAWNVLQFVFTATVSDARIQHRSKTRVCPTCGMLKKQKEVRNASLKKCKNTAVFWS